MQTNGRSALKYRKSIMNVRDHKYPLNIPEYLEAQHFKKNSIKPGKYHTYLSSVSLSD